MFRGMSLSDGFRGFDTARMDRLNIAQIYAGVRWLLGNLAPKIEDFQNIWKHIPKNSDGFTTEAEFIRVFSPRVLSSISNRIMDESESELLVDFPISRSRLGSVGEVLSPEELKLLLGTEATTAGGGAALDRLDYKIYERLKFKLQPHTTFKKLWEGHLHGEYYIPE